MLEQNTAQYRMRSTKETKNKKWIQKSRQGDVSCGRVCIKRHVKKNGVGRQLVGVSSFQLLLHHMRYNSTRHFRTTFLSRDSFSVRLVGKAAWKALKLVVLMEPLEPTSMVISLGRKPASLQETSSSEYLLVFLATASSKQSSKGTVSSMMVIADWSHTTRLGRLSVRAICCGKLYWRLGRSAVTFWDGGSSFFRKM